MKKLSKTDEFIQNYCKKYKIKLVINPNLHKNCGQFYYFLKKIELSSNFINSQIKLAVFLHEVGHMFTRLSKKQLYNNFESEHHSWIKAIELHKKYFNKSFSRMQTKFMLECLKSYSESKYYFTRKSL